MLFLVWIDAGLFSRVCGQGTLFCFVYNFCFFYSLILSFFYCCFKLGDWLRNFLLVVRFFSCFLKRENYSAGMTVVFSRYSGKHCDVIEEQT